MTVNSQTICMCSYVRMYVRIYVSQLIVCEYTTYSIMVDVIDELTGAFAALHLHISCSLVKHVLLCSEIVATPTSIPRQVFI